MTLRIIWFVPEENLTHILFKFLRCTTTRECFLNTIAFWEVTPRSLVLYQRFVKVLITSIKALSKHLWNVGKFLKDTAQHFHISLRENLKPRRNTATVLLFVPDQWTGIWQNLKEGNLLLDLSARAIHLCQMTIKSFQQLQFWSDSFLPYLHFNFYLFPTTFRPSYLPTFQIFLFYFLYIHGIEESC